MPEFPFLQVDAFTKHPFGGNPCAVLLDTDGIKPKTMAAIAREMNLPETAFVRRSVGADFAVRYFTPAEEIPLAGHPTIAVAFTLVETGRIQLTHPQTTITLEMPAGIIPVEIRSSRESVGPIFMSQLKPQFLRIYDPGIVLPVFGLEKADLIPGVPIQTVSTGTPQLMLPLRTQESLRRAQLDFTAYRNLRTKGDFSSPHLFCLHGVSKNGLTFARHLGAPPDILEDPFTGSATGGMAAYLWHYGLINQAEFIAEQGHWMGRPGMANVEIIGSRASIETVRVGGNAVTVLRGCFVL